MSRRRKSTDTTPFDTLRLEGSLFVPELLERAASGEAAFQKEADYAIPKGLKLHDEYGRAFRIATATWQAFAPQMARADLDAAAVTRAFVIDLLRQCLGYTDLATLDAPIQLGDRGFPVTAQALGGHLPVIIAPHHLGLDDPDPRFAIHGSGSRKKSAHQLAQEFLNASPNCLWAIVTNGKILRLLRDADTLTRPNFLEFDLETILRDEQQRYADFAALWRILHSSRCSGGVSPPSSSSPTSSPADCIWEKWKLEGHAQGLRVRDGLRDGVTQAILILGRGFLTHPDNTVLRQRLDDGTLSLDDYFQQFFRLIYRCLFLFCTEERDLLHPLDSSPAARKAYASGYSLRRLRRRALRQSAHDPHGDLWVSLRIVFRSLAGGQPRLALPALGGLFAETQCPDLDGASLSNRDLLSAMRELRWFFDKKTGKRSAIDYRNMGTEELGSVYESLLELVPTIDLPARSFGFVSITDAGSTAGNARKTTGSYYTADPLVMELITSALEPVIRQRLADARDLAGSPWATVAARIATDSVQRSYVHAWMVKHLAVPSDATPEAFGRAWDAIPAEVRANPLCVEALLSITVCDPSCGSGHFLLAAARRLAERLAELRAPDGAVRPDDYRHALREVASRCLYGVDINPMAVELCRVALWLETVDPGKPLGFLDHHIRCGNSLLGTTPDLIAAGLPDDTFTAIEGDDKPACAELKKRNKAERTGFGPLFAKEEDSIRDRLRQAATAIEAMDDSQPDSLHRKEAAFLTNETAPEHRHAKLLADLWCAAFVIKKLFKGGSGDKGGTGGPPVSSIPSSQPLTPAPVEGQLIHTDDDLFGQPVSAAKPTPKPKSSSSSSFDIRHSAFGITTGTLRDFVQGKPLSDELESEVNQLASQYHFFHWHLAFPQVFDQGGFDCILGNPPWDSILFREEEFFASNRPEIANASTAAVRKRLIAGLEQEAPSMFAAYLNGLREVNAINSFVRTSQRYPLCGVGRVNLFALFAECARTIVGDRGRVGQILPSGIATDDSTKLFFQALIDNGQLVSFFDFENREAIFPSVHRSYKFSIVTLRGGTSTIEEASANFVFFATRIDHLADSKRQFTLSAEEIAQLNPDTKTCPIFRTVSDAELTKAVYRRLPVLARTDWSPDLRRFLNSADDSRHFSTQAGEGLLPLYEGKYFHHYDHRWLTHDGQEERQIDDREKTDPLFFSHTRFWFSSSDATRRFGDAWKRPWILAWRDITNATNERSFISTVLPSLAIPDTAKVILVRDDIAQHLPSLIANTGSFAFDFVARQKIGGMHMSAFIVAQLPVVSLAAYAQPCPWAEHSQSTILDPPSLRDWLLPRVLELTYTAWDLEPFAQDCGCPGPPFRWDEERRFLLRCELDAAFFHLYLGSDNEWQQQPEALTRAFPTPRHAVSYIMDTFPIVKRKDEAKHGSYRTKDTILQIYDALAQSIATGTPYQTLLDPPPADSRCCHLPRAEQKGQESTEGALHCENLKITKATNPILWPPERQLAEGVLNLGSCRYYAHFSQVESLSEDSQQMYPAVWVFEAFDKAWFDQNPPPDNAEGLAEYYLRARLFVLEMTVREPHVPNLRELAPIDRATADDDETDDWFVIQAVPLGGGGLNAGIIQLAIYPNLYRPGIAATLVDASSAGPEISARLNRAVSTAHIPDATEAEVDEVLAEVGRARIEWAVVYDVGQGNAIGLCDPGGSVRAYFDIGGGVLRNAVTFPSGLTHFCFTQRPPIILSHWDFDHWSSVNRDPRAREMTWIAPRQSVGPMHLALMTGIIADGKLLLIPAGFPGMRHGQLYLECCTGRGRNHSGLALTLSEGASGDGNLMLFPGDARYNCIPSFPIPPTDRYMSVVVPHHGGDMKNRMTPLCPSLIASRLVYSCGPDNTWGHPRAITRDDHHSAGWRDPRLAPATTFEVRETANRGAGMLGHVFLGWTNRLAAPALACGSVPCQLQAQQL